MKSSKIIFFALLFVLTNGLSGQALLLNKGQSGFNIGAGLNGIDNTNNLYGEVGYSPNGKLNVYLGLRKATFDNIDDYGEFSVSTGLEYFFIKEDEEIPLSVSASIGYARTTDTGGAFSNSGLDLVGNTFGGGITAAKNINIGDKARIFPFFGIGYSSTKASITDGIDKESITSDSAFGRLGIIGALKVKNNYFNIAPQIYFRKNDTGFGVFISYNINS